MPRCPLKTREYQRKYAQSEKRKASRRRYNQSENGRAKNNAQGVRWRVDNREKYLASLRKHDLKRHYGLTIEAYNELFTKQGFKCAGCSTPDKPQWCVDHCHTTGIVRGILCHDCNLALGKVQDNPTTLRALADYLERGQL